MGRAVVAATEVRTVRCAIYTRKSTEEGLEQEFNSLDAQREAAEAYVASQKHQGWICLPERYDDGGHSGATVDRPALRRLLDNIEKGGVDCVVVYKVDRLSRSLLDFSRLVDHFERHKVSFVSITQQFQTTTSMGRLTLNVLLSFAQFEREMIAERTRDKMGAARRKGKWVGGRPILGYDIAPDRGGLVVNREEAEQVRTIFDLYLELGSAEKVWAEIGRRGFKAKRWTSRRGRRYGGGRISKGTVLHILRHPYYAGKVRYRGGVYDGEHEAIVDTEVFREVQRRLDCVAARTRAPRKPSGALLLGLIECSACGLPMTPTHTTRGKRRYHYYSCGAVRRNGRPTCPAPWLPRRQVEDAVVARLRAFARVDTAAGNGSLPRKTAPVRAACAALDAGWEDLAPECQWLSESA